jgi:alpha-glucoside transport system permease protein
MYQEDPNVGAINALGRAAVDFVSSPGVLPNALPSTPTLTGSPSTGLILQTPLQPGGVARLGLTGIAPDAVPSGAKQAVLPAAKPGDIVGVVWRDFKPGGGVAGKVESQELGLPGVRVQLRSSAGKVVQTTSSGADGTFDFKKVPAGTYKAGISSATFAKPWGGYSWLGPSLITPSLLIAYIWIWAGFAMTVPLLAPVLSVVFITMIINVLKVFDIVLALAPESTQSNANVIALAMWRTSFGGVNDFGTGSAIAVFLFVLVIPVLALNIRRFKREA